MHKAHLILITYTQTMQTIERLRPEHREYLKNGYKENKLLLSGPHKGYGGNNGGVLIGKFNSIEEANEFIENDPFYINKVAKYDVIEFDVPLFNDILEGFFSK